MLRRLWRRLAGPPAAGGALPFRGLVARRIESAIRDCGFSREQAKRATSGAMRALDELGARFDGT